MAKNTQPTRIQSAVRPASGRSTRNKHQTPRSPRTTEPRIGGKPTSPARMTSPSIDMSHLSLPHTPSALQLSLPQTPSAWQRLRVCSFSGTLHSPDYTTLRPGSANNVATMISACLLFRAVLLVGAVPPLVSRPDGFFGRDTPAFLRTSLLLFRTRAATIIIGAKGAGLMRKPFYLIALLVLCVLPPRPLQPHSRRTDRIALSW